MLSGTEVMAASDSNGTCRILSAPPVYEQEPLIEAYLPDAISAVGAGVRLRAQLDSLHRRLVSNAADVRATAATQVHAIPHALQPT